MALSSPLAESALSTAARLEQGTVRQGSCRIDGIGSRHRRGQHGARRLGATSLLHHRARATWRVSWNEAARSGAFVSDARFGRLTVEVAACSRARTIDRRGPRDGTMMATTTRTRTGSARRGIRAEGVSWGRCTGAGLRRSASVRWPACAMRRLRPGHVRRRASNAPTIERHRRRFAFEGSSLSGAREHWHCQAVALLVCIWRCCQPSARPMGSTVPGRRRACSARPTFGLRQRRAQIFKLQPNLRPHPGSPLGAGIFESPSVFRQNGRAPKPSLVLRPPRLWPTSASLVLKSDALPRCTCSRATEIAQPPRLPSRSLKRAS